MKIGEHLIGTCPLLEWGEEPEVLQGLVPQLQIAPVGDAREARVASALPEERGVRGDGCGKLLQRGVDMGGEERCG
jgi:hypothetical protein